MLLIVEMDSRFDLDISFPMPAGSCWQVASGKAIADSCPSMQLIFVSQDIKYPWPSSVGWVLRGYKLCHMLHIKSMGNCQYQELGHAATLPDWNRFCAAWHITSCPDLPRLPPLLSSQQNCIKAAI